MTITDMIAAHQRWLEAQERKRSSKRIRSFQCNPPTEAQTRALERSMRRAMELEQSRVVALQQNSAMLGGAMVRLLGGGR